MLFVIPQKFTSGNFPGIPVVKTLPSNIRVAGSIPGQGAKIPRASRPINQNIIQKQYYNKFNKDFKNGPHQKKFFFKFHFFLLLSSVPLYKYTIHLLVNGRLGWLFWLL